MSDSEDLRIYAVLMAGGSGERFWPLSRARRPKQLLPIIGEVPMVEAVVRRIEPIVPCERIYVIAGERHVPLLREILPGIPPERIVGEPFGRDTAPCVALAAALLHLRDPESVMALLPADQAVPPEDEEIFRRNLLDAARMAAREDALVTIGIPPAHASTAYGYIELGRKLDFDGGTNFYEAKRFTEKPDEETARSFLDSGRYRWNSGMFFWKTSRILAELERCAPEVHGVARKLIEIGRGGEDPVRRLAEVYDGAPRISIDYAVMEHAGRVVTAEAGFAWDDVGEWPAVARHQEPDADGNVIRGNGHAVDSEGCILVGEGGWATAVGCRDLIIVHTPDATLVAPRSEAQRIKELLKSLREKSDAQGIL